MARSVGRWMTLAVLLVAAVGCVPDTTAAPTRLLITTDLEWCGGVVPPPGEPACHTNPVAANVVVSRGRVVVASGTTTATGGLVLDVPAGSLTVSIPDAPGYWNCDTTVVTAVAGVDTAVTHTCHVYAP